MSMFEKASQLKLRFPSVLGANAVGIEEIWDLPMTSNNPKNANLLDMARSYKADIKGSNDDDFGIGIDEVSADDEVNTLRIDIIKHVISVKKAEARSRKDDRETKARKEKLLANLAVIQDAKDGAMTEEEILAELETLK